MNSKKTIPILVAGSRMDYITKEQMFKFTELLDSIILEYMDKDSNIIIIHGGCKKGGDFMADYYANDKSRHFATKVFPAKRNKYGRSAGTKSNIKLAKKYSNEIKIYNFIENKWVQP